MIMILKTEQYDLILGLQSKQSGSAHIPPGL